jgi:putative transposase
MAKASLPTWRLEVAPVKINGRARYLWQAVDESGEVLDFYATEARDEAAARRFFEQALRNPWPKAVTRSGASTPRRK